MFELILIGLTVIFFLILFRNEILEKSNLNIEKLGNMSDIENKLDKLEEQEQETRMFCKILKNKEKNQLDKVVENTNIKFDTEWKKQNELINQIKKKIINIKLDKIEKDFMEFNNKKNNKSESFKKRQMLIEKTKGHLRKPRMLNLKVNNLLK
jgi:hypothetical protein|uniref:Uncharacterized protein n=1 Tax=Mimiviridae sp. ChoanoV1 TaxID=2596887 RepID=A0A5B8IPY3_9VIRU|nr:hypothetical protein 2_86 [Mimiviridae sp. ChoanoV1]